MRRYNIMVKYPDDNKYYLALLGNDNKAYMEEMLTKVKADPKYYGFTEKGIEFKIEHTTEEEEKNAWYNLF